jgi:DNA-binding transcriptional ArsR family regulator
MMSKTDRPELRLEIECQIEAAQEQTDENCWHQLALLQVATRQRTEANLRSFPFLAALPPTPKSPNKLRRVLALYAECSFENEAAYYPSDPQSLHWLAKLTDRITARILNTVTQVEKAGSPRDVSLQHHGLTESDMREAISNTLSERVKARFIATGTDQIKADIASLLRNTKTQPAVAATASGPTENTHIFDALSEQIDDLRNECRWTVEELAEVIDVAPRSVYRHLSGEATPRKRQVAAYEKAFSDKLKRPVLLKVS